VSDRIVGKVAQVTSDRELILNRGSEDGVEVGTYFYVKDEPIEVIDPDSGEKLGDVSPIKIVVRAEEVTQRFCIARTFRTRKVKVEEEVKAGALYDSLRFGGLGNQLQPPRPAKFETFVETFRADPRKGEPIGEHDSVVRVGDMVESILPGEDMNPVTTTLFR
jgi:hypothetical protein